jgi:GH35 family endo-1,4-beta-xylanase
MITLLNKLHDDTGLPVYITEYDINQDDDATQLNRFQQQVSFFLDTEWIQGVTVWGWIYGRTWMDSTGLIRDGAPRPAMVWLMDQLGRPVPQ